MDLDESTVLSRFANAGQATRAVVFAALLLGSAAAPAQDAGPSHDPAHPDRTPTLTVTGRGEVAAPPDRATVQLGAEAQAPDAASAQSAVNATMQKALSDIQDAGIPQTAIQTTGLTLSPVHAPHKPGQEAEPPRVIAYRAANTIRVQVDDLQRVGKVIDAGVAAGANRLQGVSFELQNELPHRIRALTIAVQEAKAKAQAMAPALQVELVKVRSVTEGGVSILPQAESFAGARMMAMDAAPTPVQPGELRVEASVTIRYEIAPVK